MIRRALYLGTCAASLSGSYAAAQTVAESSPRLEEIVVTAQRREENLQDVPVAVTALTADAISNRGIRGVDDLSAAVPSLNVTRFNGPQFYLRGIGTPGGQMGVDQAVAVFVDGVYQPVVSASNIELNDIQRVEVLKGPQGTLFGRNATGGVVSIITRDPVFENHANVELGLGNYNTINAQFYGNLAYSDNIAQSLSVYYNNQLDGWGKNVATGNDAYKLETFAARSKLRLTASDRTDVILAADYSRQAGDIGSAIRPAPTSYTILIGPPQDNGFYTIESNVPQNRLSRNYGASLTIKHDFDFATLTSISAYRHARNYIEQELDMSALDIYQYNLIEDADQISQELQLSNKGGGKLEWTIGAFYLHNDFSTEPLNQFGGFVGFIPGVPVGTYVYQSVNRQKVNSIAAYAQATYELLTATRLTLGARYTRDKRRFTGQDYTAPFAPGPTPSYGPLTPFGAPANQSDTTSKPTWRIVLDHKFTPDVMAYLSYSRGFKSGGYNNTSITAPALRPEILDAYEAGLKSRLLSDRVQFNLSAYLYKYQDLQLTKIVSGASLLLNAAKAEFYGADAELVVAATNNLTLNAGAGLIHSKFESFPNGPVYRPVTTPPFGGAADPNGEDLSGNRTPKAPKLTANAAANYQIALPDDSELAFNVAIAYNSGFFWEPSNRIRQKAYTLVNAQAIWRDSGDNLYVKAWARNLFDTRYYSYQVESQVGDLAQPAAPRTFGLSVGVKY